LAIVYSRRDDELSTNDTLEVLKPSSTEFHTLSAVDVTAVQFYRQYMKSRLLLNSIGRTTMPATPSANYLSVADPVANSFGHSVIAVNAGCTTSVLDCRQQNASPKRTSCIVCVRP